MCDKPKSRAKDSALEADAWRTVAHQEASSSEDDHAGLQIRCPCCSSSVRASADSSFADLDCLSCGERFSLVGNPEDEGAIKTIGHFELIEQLGVGSFGSVWKARDTKLDRAVAVKIPREGQLPAGGAEKFLREARAAAQLKHPNIVGVHEVGRDAGRVYIVCDLIHGLDLSDWLEGKRPTPREAAQLCIKVADALQHAHEKGIVHRDLKPHNIMLDYDEQPFLMDFGLARRDAGEMTLTVDGQILGTPAYMSPEQARGEAHQADRRTDIYSLGVILYQLLTGELPFRGRLRMLLNQILHDEPPKPRKLSANVPRDLETICLKCMEKDPHKRYETAAGLANDLRHFVRGEPIRARPISTAGRAWRWCRRNPTVASLVFSVALLIVVSSVGAAFYSSQLYRAKFQREAMQRTEDAADFAMLKEQIRAERWGEAEQTLQSARQRISGCPALENRQGAWTRLRNVVDFYRGNDATWYHWGEEDYEDVMQAATATLQGLGALDRSEWWDALPSDDLDWDEQRRLEQEVYRLLMLHSAVHTVMGSVLAEQVAMGKEELLSQAMTLFQSALQPITRAQAWERQQTESISITSKIMEQINRGLLQQLGQSANPSSVAESIVRPSSTDNYFLGLMFFVVQRSSSVQNPLCSDEANAQIEPSTEPEGLLIKFLRTELTKHEISQAPTPLETSERMLRIAAGSERRYWPNFALGRTLFFERKFSEAELAFSTCASLRPHYARSFEQRALMRALQARETDDPQNAATLRKLAREDSDRALRSAAKAGDPSTWWPRGDLHTQLDEPEQALAAYQRALQWEDDIRQKVNRRNNIECVRRLAESVIENDSPPALVADALSVLALSLELTENAAEALERARAAVHEALQWAPRHPHALTVRGRLRWRETGLDTSSASQPSAAQQQLAQSALADFDSALQRCPDSYLAAVGRAQVLEVLGQWAKAESAWRYLLTELSEPSTPFFRLAITPAQQEQARQGCARAAENAK